jgi:aspartate-semialdehyde dehydrogenase
MNQERKLNVGILGATGAVGQRFVAELENHPWFKIQSLMASERSMNKPYHAATRWILDISMPANMAEMPVRPCQPTDDLDFVFSGLDAAIAGPIERLFAQSGIPVISNTRTHRMDENVPLIIPEVNPHHLKLITSPRLSKEIIVTNPNCSTIVLCLALAPLQKLWGIKRVIVSTMQALSGAGYPGVSSNEILDNVIPFISGEETKMESEPKKIFGYIKNDRVEFAKMKISARCHRVMVSDGHLLSISVELKKKASKEEIKEAWSNFSPEINKWGLPSAPEKPIFVFNEEDRPQPRKDRLLGKGMIISVGRLDPCNVLDYKFNALGHNTIRGAAGGSILVAELMVKYGCIPSRVPNK